MSFLQTVSNWIIGDYRVRTTKASDNGLIQHVRLTDDSGGYVSPSGATFPATATVSSVSGAASSTTILASNSGRYGGSVYNDSSALLYLLYGAGVASSTNFTTVLFPNSYHEINSGYTGQLNGIWASATGAARVTELTA